MQRLKSGRSHWGGLLTVAMVLLMALVILCLGATTAAASATGHITGVVTDAVTGNPVSDVTVTAYKLWYSVAGSRTTNSAGEYDLSGLEPGTYVVRFEDTASTYVPEYYNGVAEPFPEYGTQIVLADGQTQSGVNATLDVGVYISGQVTSAVTGDPISGVSVFCYFWEDGNVKYSHGGFLTDSSGAYRSDALREGTYTVEFSSSSDYVPQYYDGQYDWYGADQFTLSAGQTKEDVDAIMAPSAHITGQVTEAGTGTPLSVSVMALRDNGSWWEWAWGASTDELGQYDISRLTEGSYKVQFDDGAGNHLSQWYDHQDSQGSADVVSVGVGATQSNINAELAIASHITGRVVDAATGDPIAETSVIAYTDTWGWGGMSSTNTNGEYDIGGLSAGNYVVQFTGYTMSGPSPYVEQYYDGRPTFESADLVPLGAADTQSGINAALVVSAHIAGQVTDALTGEPVPGVQVMAYMQDGSSWIPVSYGGTDGYGAYQIDRLGPGTYTVGFYDPNTTEGAPGGYAWQFYNGQVSQDSADTIVLEAGQTVTGVDGQVSTGAHISGVVTDGETLEPVAGIGVDILTTDGSEWYFVSSITTDYYGHYDQGSLIAGTYYVAFRDYDGRYESQYYDAETYVDQADPVVLSGGELRTGVDAVLSASAHITGTVTDSSTDSPIAGVQVTAYRTSDAGWGDETYTYTDYYGAYDLGGLVPGTYVVQFYNFDGKYARQYYAASSSRGSATSITLGKGETVPEIDASMLSDSEITGRVVDDATEDPVGGVMVYAYIQSGSSWELAESSQTDDTGRYAIYGLAEGTHIVKFDDSLEWSGGRYEPQYYGGDSDQASADLIIVPANDTVPDIDGRLTPSAHITGTVTDDATGQPVRNISAVVYVQNGSEWDWAAQRTTDEEGQYDVGGLAAGIYHVGYLVSSGYGIVEYYNDKATLDAADDVEAYAGETTSGIDAGLSLIPAVTSLDTTGGPVAGGTPVTIFGTGFNRAKTVAFGLTPAAGFQVISPTQIVTIAPPHAFGTVQVRVSSAFGVSADTEADDFRYAGVGSISGVVTDSAGGLPLPGISVTVYVNVFTSWIPVGFGSTDVYGQYAVDGLGTGTYFVEFSDPDDLYDTQYYDGQSSLASATEVVVPEGGENPSAINAAMSAVVGIRGTVIEAGSGLPLPGILGVAIVQSGDTWNFAASTMTDSYGVYTLAGLGAGTYRVGFVDPDGAHAQQFYNGAPTLVEGDNVLVDGSGLVSGINGALLAAAHISGVVTDGMTGEAIPGIKVTACVSDSDVWHITAMVTYTDMYGHFDLGGLPAETYKVQFTDPDGRYADQYFRNATSMDSAETIALAEGASAGGIDAALVAAGASLSGTVTDSESGYPLPGISVNAYAQDGSDWLLAVSAQTDIYGKYSIYGLETGTYIVEFLDDDWFYFTQYYNGADTLGGAEQLTLSAEDALSDIDAALVACSHIRGLVTEAMTGEPVPGFDVWAYVAGETSGDPVAHVVTDIYGAYDIAGLADGEYVVKFQDVSHTYLAQYFNGRISAARADIVTLGSSGPTVVNGVNAAVSSGTRISGLVTDYASGDPLPGISVRVYRQIGSDWEVAVDNQPTDIYGEYHVDGLEPGIYAVQFSDPDGHYGVQYYNGQTAIESAELLELAMGDDVSGVSAVMTPPAPIVVNVNPSSGPASGGTSVIITGSDFSEVSAVTFGGVASTFRVDSLSQITATSPAHADGTVDVAVTTPGGSSYTAGVYDDFTYLARFQQDNVNLVYSGSWTPKSEAAASGGTHSYATATGAKVTIYFTGTRIDWLAKISPSFGVASVSLDGAPAVSVDTSSATGKYQQKVWSSGTISDGAHILVISYTGTAGAYGTGKYVDIDALDVVGALNAPPAPSVTSLDPASGYTMGGTSVVITGTDFTGVSAVTFGGVPATSFTVNSENQITAVSPAHAGGTVDVKVTRYGLDSDTSGTGDDFTYVARFQQDNVNLVYSGSWTPKSEAAASGGTHSYATATGAKVTIYFTGTRIDWLAKISPSFGVASVSLDGAPAVSVDTSSATGKYQQKVWSSGTISDGAHILVISYTGTAGAYGTGKYVDIDALDVVGALNAPPAPSVTALSPTSGTIAGGTSVVITGTDFTGVSAVTFGGVPATSFTVNSENQITAVSPAHAGGTVDVKVTRYGLDSDTSGTGDDFTYEVPPAPTVTALSPTSGTIAGGTSVVITGTDFTGVSAVTFGGVPATSFTVNSENQITAVSPAHAGGTVDVKVTRYGLDSDTSGTGDDFTYVARFQQDNVNLVYSGSWTPKSEAAASGGTHSYATATGAKVTIYFTGTRIDWLAKISPSFGVASVSLDGAPAVSVDTSSATGKYQQKVWSSGTISDGAHILVISYTGTAGAYGTGKYVDIDALDVVGALNAPPAPSVTSLDPASGYTMGGTSVVITGTDFTGVSAVTFGGVPATSFTVNSENQITAVSPAHAGGTVDVKVTRYGLDSDTSGTGDDFTYVARFQQDNVNLVYSGSWTPKSEAAASGGTHSYATATGAKVTIYFTGTRIDWLAKISPSFGVASVSLDGAPAVSVDTSSATGKYQQKVWSSGTISDGAHILVISYTGTAGAYGTGKYVDIDALDVVGALNAPPAPSVTSLDPASGYTMGGTSVVITGTDFTGVSAVTFGGVPATSFTVNSENQITAVSPAHAGGTVDVKVTRYGLDSDTSGTGDDFTYVARFQQDNVNLVYSGSWTPKSEAAASGGTHSYATATGAKVTIYFTGTRIDWLAKISPSFGVASVSLDGAPAVSVDTSSATGKYQQKVWSSGTISDGAHILVISYTGTAGAYGTGKYVDIDALDVVGALNAPPAPTVTALSPTSGTIAGGTSVVITGTDFTGVSAVTFGGVPATSFTVNSENQITAVSPAHAGGTVDVKVTRYGLDSDTSGTGDDFTYEEPPEGTTTTTTLP